MHWPTCSDANLDSLFGERERQEEKKEEGRANEKREGFGFGTVTLFCDVSAGEKTFSHGGEENDSLRFTTCRNLKVRRAARNG
jgi:hypothetical protein